MIGLRPLGLYVYDIMSYVIRVFPHISVIKIKPEKIGMGLNYICCAATVFILWLEIQNIEVKSGNFMLKWP